MNKKNKSESNESVLDQRDTLLHAALLHIPSVGWNMGSFGAGATDIGLQPVEAYRVFPGGPSEVACYYSNYLDQKMLKVLSKIDLESLRIRDRIAVGVRTRIEAVEANREAIKRLMSYLILPGKTHLAARLTWNTCDTIWFASGDTATDFNYYTKRALLFPVFASTLLFWLVDDSKDSVESWDYLDRRIGDVLKIPVYSGKIKKALCRIAFNPKKDTNKLNSE